MLAAVLLFPRPACADAWWGRDKALHFTASIALSSIGYAVSVPMTEQREYRVLAGAATALTLGIAKEGYDALGHGDPSLRDLTWDVAGTAVGVLIAYAVDCILTDPARRDPALASTGNAIRIAF